MPDTAVQISVRGRVQGVGYRYFARQKASLLGVRGFVRNRPDGSVEAHGEADAAALDAFVKALREGPSFGRVESIEVNPMTPRGYDAFEIR